MSTPLPISSHSAAPTLQKSTLKRVDSKIHSDSKPNTPKTINTVNLERNEQKEKRNWMDTCHRWRSKAVLLERDIQNCLAKSHFRDELKPFFEAEIKFSASLKSEILRNTSMDAKLKAIKTLVRKFQDHVQKSGSGETYLTILKQLMENSEASISEFKEKQRSSYDTLLHTESSLTSDLLHFNTRLQDFESTSQSELEKPNPSSKLTYTRSSDPILIEVQAFQDYLARFGGHTGGWDDLTHAAFVKIRNKFGPDHPRYYPSLLNTLPSYDINQLKEHEEWYLGYLDLNQKRKDALELWRQRKTASKQAEKPTIEPVELAVRDTEEDRKKREEQKQLIKQWKEVKRRKEETERQRKLEGELERKRLEERRRLAEAERIKRDLALRQQLKTPSPPPAPNVESDQDRQKRLAEMTRKIQERQEKDLELTLKRRTLVQAAVEGRKMTKLNVVEALAEKVSPSIQVSRDPSRLLKVPERKRGELDEVEKVSREWRVSQGARAIPTRAPVSWRANI